MYPLKFEPICLEKIWGGNRLKTLLGKKYETKNCGESWELSGVEGNISVVANGFLKGNDLNELIGQYQQLIDYKDPDIINESVNRESESCF